MNGIGARSLTSQVKLPQRSNATTTPQPEVRKDQVELSSTEQPKGIWQKAKDFGNKVVNLVVIPGSTGAVLGASSAAAAALVPTGLAGAIILGIASKALWSGAQHLEKSADSRAKMAAVRGLEFGATSALGGTFAALVGAPALGTILFATAGGVLAAGLLWQALKAQGPEPSVNESNQPQTANPLSRERSVAAIESSGQKLFAVGLLGPRQVAQDEALKSLDNGGVVLWAKDEKQAFEIERGRTERKQGWNEHLLDDKNLGLSLFAATGSTEGFAPEQKAVADQVVGLRQKGYSINDADAWSLIQSRDGKAVNHEGLPVLAIEVSGPSGSQQVRTLGDFLALDGKVNDSLA